VSRVQLGYTRLVAGLLNPEEGRRFLLEGGQRALGQVRVALKMAREQLCQQAVRISGQRQVEVSWDRVDLRDRIPSYYQDNF
jgi:hypothetical protein